MKGFVLLLSLMLILLVILSCDGNPVNSSPTVTLTSPADGSIFTYCEAITFTSIATDSEDGELSNSSIVWFSDKDGKIGKGVALITAGLTENSHVITLIATDSKGSIDSAKINITINPNLTWEKVFGDEFDRAYERGYAVSETSDGGFIICGSKIIPLQDHNLYLIKTDNSGNHLWEKNYGGRGDDVGYSVCETSDGGYVIAGTTFSDLYGGVSYSYNVYLVKTDIDGNLLWQKTFGSRDYYNIGHSVCETSDGGYIIAGTSYSTNVSSSNVYLIKTDNSGNLSWEKTFGGTNYSSGYSVCPTSNGGYIITGSITDESYETDVYLVKVDNEGNIIWEKTFGGTSGKSVLETSDGGYIITGTDSNYLNSTFGGVYLLKIDINGNFLWDETFKMSELEDVGQTVFETTDGNYILAGTTEFWGHNSKAFLIKTDNFGNLIWKKIYAESEYSQGFSASLCSDGGFILTGHVSPVFNGVYEHVYIVKTDNNGNVFCGKF